MMNANSDTQDSRLHMCMANKALHDIAHHLSPDFDTPHIYIYVHGSKRINSIVVSKEILDASTRTGHTSFGYPFVSEHRGVYMYISIELLYGSQLHDPASHT